VSAARVLRGDSNAGAIEPLRQEMTEALKGADAMAIAGIAASYSERVAELEAKPNCPPWAHAETSLTVGQHSYEPRLGRPGPDPSLSHVRNHAATVDRRCCCHGRCHHHDR
jgi:hypothetical protein